MTSNLTTEELFQLLRALKVNDSLQQHFEPASPQGSVVPMSTPIVPRGAQNHAFLDRHFHKTVDGYHVCKICKEVAIKRSGDAKRHWMSKHGGQNPKCRKCAKPYSRKDALMKHEGKCMH